MTEPTPINEKTSPLYAACVGFMASERGAHNSWEQVAKQAHIFVASGIAAELPRAFKDVEKQVKLDFSIPTMPKAWRSAKSTALKAVKNEVPLIDPAGNVYGKTSIERAIKTGTAPTAPSVASTPVDEVIEILYRTKKPLTKITSLTSFERLSLNAHVNSLRDLIKDIPDA